MKETDLILDMSSLGGYKLLKSYETEAQILSAAYKKSEKYWRSVYKWLTLPLIVTSTLMSIFSTIELNKYVLMGISFTSLLLSGFNQAINPNEKTNRANQVSTEFGEIHSTIRQFIGENSKTKDQIKIFSQNQLSMLDVWKSLSPPISSKYMEEARIQYTVRPTRMDESNR